MNYRNKAFSRDYSIFIHRQLLVANISVVKLTSRFFSPELHCMIDQYPDFWKESPEFTDQEGGNIEYTLYM